MSILQHFPHTADLMKRLYLTIKKLISNSTVLLIKRISGVLLILAVLNGCASVPPGSNFPKVASVALLHPEDTRLGQQFDHASHEHAGHSGFRIISSGADGFLLRMQMIDAAQRSLDLQYFIFRGDDTGKLITDALLRAAARGVRVRLLIDDAERVAGDDQIAVLAANPAIQIRIFNPALYRGDAKLFRATEFIIHASRLDYRMHNKLFVADNAIALIGGRNIGDHYFQINPEGQFADDDVFAAGPVAQQLSTTFDEYWNSPMAIPVQALTDQKLTRAALNAHFSMLNHQKRELQADKINYVERLATGEPLKGILSGRLLLVWADAQVICDSPDKKQVENGAIAGRLMDQSVTQAALAVQSELLIVTPFLIPGTEGMQLFKTLRERGVQIRILTNSLKSSRVIVAQAGYMHYRVPLLEQGVELYELRALLGNTKGSGETKAIARYGNYSLHAKLFVFDRKRVFIGSMNFDQRSMHLNTELGLIIDSPELAQQVAQRFDAMVQPANAYKLELRSQGGYSSPKLVWDTLENGRAVEYDSEPARSGWQDFEAQFFSLLPLDDEL